MNNQPIANRCPKCQAPLPANAPEGLCSKCLLAAAATPTEAGQPAQASAAPPSLETVAAAFPQLEILELIGSGGMGTVYKARQSRLDRFVALKLLPHSLASDPAFAERFSREARLLGRLNHPNIVTVHDFGQLGGFFYLLMEYVDGVNLRQAMAAGRFTPQQAMMLVPKICEALQFAHDEGILHRDIKPSNILLDTRGRVKIADFGIAKLIGDRTRDVTLTASGAAIGTPQYMAPEQLEHPQDVDQRADIYSLGVVFYEMLTGELPIGRFSPPSEKAAVDSRVDDVVFHALEKEREKRFRSADEVKTSVEAITASRGNADAAVRPGVARSSRLGSPGTPIMSGKTPSSGPGATIRAAAPTSGMAGVGVFVPDAVPALDTSPTSDFILCNSRLPRMAHAIMVYALLIAPFLWALGQTLRYPAGDLPSNPGTGSLEGAWKFFGEMVGGLLTTLLLMAGALKLRVLHRSGPRILRLGIWLRLWGLVLGVFIAIWATVLGPGPGPAGSAVPTAISVVLAVKLVAVGVELAMLVWLRRNRKWLDELCDAFGPSASLAALLSPLPTVTAGVPEGTNARANGATCYFSTPERMRNCFPAPQAHIFQCKGELRLEACDLVFISPWRTRVVIPLKDIRDLTVGQFQMWTTPWVMKYERVNFLSITFGTGNQGRTIHLTPVPAGADSTAPINALVADWFEAIRDAVVARTGAVPPASDTGAVTIGAQRSWNQKGGPFALAFVAVWVAFILCNQVLTRYVPSPIGMLLGILMFLLLIANVWYCHGFLKANRALKLGRLDEVTSNDPPDSTVARVNDQLPPPPGQARISWLAVASAVCSIPSWLLVIASLNNLYNSLGSDGLPPGDFTFGLFELLVLGTGGFVGLAALMLGKEALRQIRLGGGRLPGARLAVIGVLGIPTGLLVKFLPFLLAAMSRSFGWQPSPGQGQLFTGAVLVGILLLAAWAAQAVRRWAKCAAASGPAIIRS